MAPKWPQLPMSPNVRFGSKADMCSAQADVRFVLIADMFSRLFAIKMP